MSGDDGMARFIAWKRRSLDNYIDRTKLTDDDRAKLVEQLTERTMVDCSDWTDPQLTREGLRQAFVTEI